MNVYRGEDTKFKTPFLIFEGDVPDVLITILIRSEILFKKKKFNLRVILDCFAPPLQFFFVFIAFCM